MYVELDDFIVGYKLRKYCPFHILKAMNTWIAKTIP